MKGVEIDFVVVDSLFAMKLYEKLFEVEIVEKTNFPTGQNEIVFNIYGTRFHMLDENKEFGLVAPGKEGVNSVWFNLVVPNIKVVHNKALKFGCIEIQPVTELKDYGVSNSIFKDPFGYVWMLHEIHRKVSFDERLKIFEEEGFGNR